MDPIKRQARSAGLLYLLCNLPAPFSLIYIPGVLIVPGDATATADHVRAHETLLRMGIAGEAFNSIVIIFAALAFYRLFKPVGDKLAAAMLALILVPVPIALLNMVDSVAASTLARGATFLSAFDRGQLDGLTYLFLRLHNQGLQVASIFWGLWLLPLGVLVMRSRFIPGVLGICLLLAGFGYVMSSFTSLVLPHYAHLVSRFAMPLYFGEAPLLWLVIWGAKAPPSVAPGSLPVRSLT